MTDHTPVQGWYEDPADPANHRWWDGNAWTDAVRPGSVVGEADAYPLRDGIAQPPDGQAADRRQRVIGGAAGLMVIVLLGGGLWWWSTNGSPDDGRAVREAVGSVEGSGAGGPAADRPVTDDSAPGAARDPGTLDDGAGAQPASAWQLQEIGILRQVPPETELNILAISPDGQTVLTPAAEAGDEAICWREVDRDFPQDCVEAPEMIDSRYISWSQDGRTVVFGDDVLTFGSGGDVYVLDLVSGSLSRPTDAVPRPRQTGEADAFFRAYARPTLDPRGERIAAFRLLRGSPTAVVVLDAVSGELLEELDAPEGFASLVWSPDGDTLWINSYGLGNRRSMAQGVSFSGGGSQLLDTTVPLEMGDTSAELVQVDDSGAIGLLQLRAAMFETPRPNLPYLAVIDLRTGQIAPVLTEGPSDLDDEVRHARLWTGRLSDDGRHVTAVHATALSTFDPSGDVRLVRITVGSILAGAPEPHVVVDGLAARLALPRPASLATETGRMSLRILPVDDDVILVPVALLADESGFGGQSPDAFLYVRADGRW